MASSYSTRLRLELPATGEQSGTWGQTMNAFMGTFLEDAICGYSYVNVASGDYTLTVSSPGGSTEEARRAVLVVQGAPGVARSVIVPLVQKTYTVVNQTGQAVTIKGATGTGIAVPANATQLVACDGTNCTGRTLPYAASGLTLSGTLSVAGATSLGTTPGGTTPLNVTASTGAFAIDLRGRPADSIGILRFMDTTGATELARLQSGAGAATIALAQGASGAVSVFSTDTAGNIGFTKAGTFGTGLTVSANGANIIGASTVNGNFTVLQSGVPAAGLIYLGNTGSRYLQWDGANYQFGSSGTAWHTGNFNPAAYAPLGGANFGGGISAPYMACTGNLDVAASLGVSGNISGGAALTIAGGASVGSLSTGGVVSCIAPDGGAGGRAIPCGDNRIGNMNVGGGAFIAVRLDGANWGINVFSSDERRKQDIAPAAEAVLPLLRQIRFIDFRFKPAPGQPLGDLQPGGISAQQVRTIRPEWVHETDDEERSLIPNAQLLLTNALKAIVELDAKVTALETRLAAVCPA